MIDIDKINQYHLKNPKRTTTQVIPRHFCQMLKSYISTPLQIKWNKTATPNWGFKNYFFGSLEVVFI